MSHTTARCCVPLLAAFFLFHLLRWLIFNVVRFHVGHANRLWALSRCSTSQVHNNHARDGMWTFSKGLLTFYLPKAHLKRVLFKFESNKIPYKSWTCTVPSRATWWKQVRRHVTLMFKPECVAEFEMHHLIHVQMQRVFILTSFYLRVVCSTLSHNRLDKENLTWSCHSSAFHHQSL